MSEVNQLEITALEKANDDFISEFAQAPFKGCYKRAKTLAKTLEEIGLNVELLDVRSKEGTLTHECNGLWQHHVVVHSVDADLIFDPSYSGRIPLPKDKYKKVYLERGIFYTNIN